jgi:predicted DNA-binding helix-hairpin-helix protein
MVTLEKIACLALGSSLDSLGAPLKAASCETSSETGREICHDNLSRLAALGMGTKYDVCASPHSSAIPGVCHSFTPDGRCISLFKTLYTNSCSHQCNYCINASGCRCKPEAFSYTPEELARLSLSLYKSNYVEGLFLSSAAGRDEDVIMEKMIEVVQLLRGKYQFKGYIHLKILPGASKGHIEEAMALSDRVSVNLEASSPSRMGEMSPSKDYSQDILQRQRYIRDLSRKIDLPAGQTTQLVVGGSDESDEEIFRRVVYEYEEMEVRRAYYSAFNPLKGTPFETRARQPLWREHRLYQIDWLYRVYHFKPEDICLAFDEGGFLFNSDPKIAIARGTLDGPLDLNSAGYRDLIKVPGIGPRSARRILKLRKSKKIGKKDLHCMGVRLRKASPFLIINSQRDATLDMWSL